MNMHRAACTAQSLGRDESRRKPLDAHGRGKSATEYLIFAHDPSWLYDLSMCQRCYVWLSYTWMCPKPWSTAPSGSHIYPKRTRDLGDR